MRLLEFPAPLEVLAAVEVLPHYLAQRARRSLERHPLVVPETKPELTLSGRCPFSWARAIVVLRHRYTWVLHGQERSALRSRMFPHPPFGAVCLQWRVLP